LIGEPLMVTAAVHVGPNN